MTGVIACSAHRAQLPLRQRVHAPEVGPKAAAAAAQQCLLHTGTLKHRPQHRDRASRVLRRRSRRKPQAREDHVLRDPHRAHLRLQAACLVRIQRRQVAVSRASHRLARAIMRPRELRRNHKLGGDVDAGQRIVARHEAVAGVELLARLLCHARHNLGSAAYRQGRV
eukprot:359258-Chlamydomonas_euryale.AAC.26